MTQYNILQSADELFEQRTRAIQSRIQILQKDLLVVSHPEVRRVILIELDNLMDDYIQRKFARERKENE